MQLKTHRTILAIIEIINTDNIADSLHHLQSYFCDLVRKELDIYPEDAEYKDIKGLLDRAENGGFEIKYISILENCKVFNDSIAYFLQGPATEEYEYTEEARNIQKMVTEELGELDIFEGHPKDQSNTNCIYFVF